MVCRSSYFESIAVVAARALPPPAPKCFEHTFLKGKASGPKAFGSKSLAARLSEDSHRLLAFPDEDSGGSGSVDQTLDEVEVAFSAHPSWQAPQEGAEEGAEELDRVVQEVSQKIGRTAQDTEPILTLLKANWYNSVDSLALASL